jgi:excinuclease ABC subunit C
MPDKTEIKKKLSSIPEQPGVYLMKEKGHRIIYIGKAASLKKRVSSYFTKSETDIKTRVLVRAIADIEYIITDTEIEALILESSLIQQHKPKYNVRKKDDKKYPYIAVTLTEDYPRVIYTRNLSNSGDRYFGPYTDARAARNIISMINKTFKLKTCKKEIPLREGERPCLNFQMKRCSGICTGETSAAEYRSLVENAISFLEGNIDPVLENLEKMMKSYSSEYKFEQASGIRDIIFDIQRLSEDQKVSVPIGRDQDFVGISVEHGEAVLLLFQFRKGVLIGRKISVYDNVEYSEPGDIIRTFLLEHFKETEVPLKVVTQYPVSDRHLVEEYLTKKASRKTLIVPPSGRDENGIMKMIIKNIDLIAAERRGNAEEESQKAGLGELTELLGLDKEPLVIECFDISNIQGKNAVASMVMFREGKPSRSDYRRYRIRGMSTPNDPAMMHEAVSRRIQYLVNEGLELPGLLVVDGGKTQLSRAKEAAENFDVEIKIVSIAKRFEEIYFDLEAEPLRLPESSPGLKIIKEIRDEAHRFAISYHRVLRDKSMKQSALDSIPDVGEKTRKLLLKRFKSLKGIREAGVEELREVEGIGEKTAKKIYEFFHKG